MVVITIITLVILVRHESFNSSTLLRSLGYSVALSVRQAQTYGTTVRAFGGSSSIQGYGIQFTTDLSRYFLFADLPNASGVGDGKRAAGGAEDLPPFTLNRSYQIKDFCGVLVGTGGLHCYSTTPSSNRLTALTIFFKRPSPDSNFSAETSAGATGESYQYAYIQVKAKSDSANASVRTVKVSQTGQITVCPLNADPANC